MRYVVTLQGKDHIVELPKGEGAARTILVDGEKHEVDAVTLGMGSVHLIIDGHSYDLDFERPAEATDALDPRLHVRVRGEVVKLEVMEERRRQLAQTAARGGGKEGPASVASPMPGKVVKLLKAVGDVVKAGEGVVVVEAMKMENELRAPSAGAVKEIRVKEGQAVEGGAVLVVIA